MTTAHVTFKPGAKITKLAPAGVRILAAVDQAARYSGRVLTITSGSEKRGRLETDPHMTGEAFDISVNEMTAIETRVLWRSLSALLGPAFTVLIEAPPDFNDLGLNDILYRSSKATGLHIHIQRKKGTTWPPQ